MSSATMLWARTNAVTSPPNLPRIRLESLEGGRRIAIRGYASGPGGSRSRVYVHTVKIRVAFLFFLPRDRMPPREELESDFWVAAPEVFFSGAVRAKTGRAAHVIVDLDDPSASLSLELSQFITDDRGRGVASSTREQPIVQLADEDHTKRDLTMPPSARFTGVYWPLNRNSSLSIGLVVTFNMRLEDYKEDTYIAYNFLESRPPVTVSIPEWQINSFRLD
jgi:hypothetical protein